MSVFLYQSNIATSEPSTTATILIGLYIVLFGFYILLLFSRYRIKQERKNLKKEINELKNGKEKIKSRLKLANEEIIKLQRNYKACKASNNHPEQEKQDHKNANISQSSGKGDVEDESVKENTLTSHESQKDINPVVVEFMVSPTFYLGFPDNEGAFFAPEATENPTEVSFYKIQNSKLSLYEDAAHETMQAALNFIENHVKRACVISNAREPYHTRLIMEKAGRVEKVDEDFRIIEKLRVRYE